MVTLKVVSYPAEGGEVTRVFECEAISRSHYWAGYKDNELLEKFNSLELGGVEQHINPDALNLASKHREDPSAFSKSDQIVSFYVVELKNGPAWDVAVIWPLSHCYLMNELGKTIDSFESRYFENKESM